MGCETLRYFVDVKFALHLLAHLLFAFCTLKNGVVTTRTGSSSSSSSI